MSENKENLIIYIRELMHRHDNVVHWPKNTYLQKRLPIVRANPLYQNLYTDVKKEGDCNGRK